MKHLFLLLFLLSFNSNAQNCETLLQELKIAYDSESLSIEEIESAIDSCNDPEKYPELFYYRGMYAFDNQNFPLGVFELERIQKFAKGYKFQYKIAHNLGILYLLQGEVEVGKKYFKQSYDIALANNDAFYTDYSMESLLAAELESGNTDYLLIYENYFKKRDFKGDHCAHLHTLTFIAEYYLVYNMFDKAEAIMREHYNSTVSYIDCPLDVMSSYTVRSRIAIEKEQSKLSLEFLDSIPLKEITLLDRKSVYKHYKETYTQLGNQEYVDIYSDSLLEVTNNNKLENNEANLNLLQEVGQKEDDYKDAILKLSIYLIIFVVLILISIYLIVYYRKSKKDLQVKSDYYKENYNNLWGSYQLTNQKLEVLRKELLAQKSEDGKSTFGTLINDINIHLDNTSEDSHKHVNMVESTFIQNLKKEAPYLTDKEVQMCFFFKLNLTHKKIAEILSKTEKSVESYKYRISKKVREKHNLEIMELLQNID